MAEMAIVELGERLMEEKVEASGFVNLTQTN